MKFRDLLRMQEGDIKYQALAIAKDVHTRLAELTFIEMLSVMSSDNPAKKEVQELETKINQLTTEVGEFIQRHIPDVADAGAGDTEEFEDPDEESDSEDEKPKKKDKSKKKEEDK